MSFWRSPAIAGRVQNLLIMIIFYQPVADRTSSSELRSAGMTTFGDAT